MNYLSNLLKLFSVFLCFIVSLSVSAQEISIKGKITDKESKDVLIGANVQFGLIVFQVAPRKQRARKTRAAMGMVSHAVQNADFPEGLRGKFMSISLPVEYSLAD